MSLLHRRQAGIRFTWRIGGRAEAARKRGRRPRLEPLESRRLLSNTTITDFPSPTAGGGEAWIAAGPDGNLWFTESSAGKVGMINPTTHATTDFLLTTADARPEGITAGPDGNLWFTESGGNNIVMINPTTHVTTLFPVPTVGAEPSAIATGPDGNLWFTESDADQIGMINPTTHAITEFLLPTAGAQPEGITAGPDGNLWFTEFGTSKIGKINPTTHAITEYALPTAGSEPFSIATGSDGNLWFAESGSGKIGTINPTTHAITEFAIPTPGSGPAGITAGPDGNLWFTEGNNSIGTINPTSHAITEFAIPTAGSEAEGIVTGPDGNVWFAEIGASKIGVVTLGTSLSITTEPPALVAPGTAFGLTVSVEYQSGLLDTSFNGPVTVALVNPGTATLGGTLTVTAKDGVATFAGLTINQVGSGYQLIASTDPLTTTHTSPVTVDVAPTITGEKVKVRHGRVFFVLDFSKGLAPGPAQDAANYTVTQTRRTHRISVTKAVRLDSVVYDATKDAVSLEIARDARFPTGGKIVVNAMSPLGLTDTLGDYLDGTGAGVPGVDATLLIAPGGRGIKLVT